MTDTRNPVSERMMKHTPGPWSVEDPMGPEIICIVADAHREVYNWKHVAQIGVDDDDDKDIPAVEAKANARLIAAAPCLYAAIKNSDDAHWTPAMRAALAKVEGTAP